MKHEELLLSNYSWISGLLNSGVNVQQITQDLNQHLGIQITTRQLRYLIDRVNNKTIHKEYDNVVVIDGLMDAWDKKLGQYCVDFQGLLITYKSLAYLTKPEYIITGQNITTILGKDSLLYAKRILKLYHIPDMELLQQHKLVHPKQADIDLEKLTVKIHVDFNNEFATMLVELRNKYIQFMTNNIKRSISNE